MSGCLGVLRRGGGFEKKELKDTDEDYSREMAASVVRAVERICQSENLGPDSAKVKHILDKVVVAVADRHAPAQKCLGFLATGSMPNIKWCGRDRAHALRIATAGPLSAEPHFKESPKKIINIE